MRINVPDKLVVHHTAVSYQSVSRQFQAVNIYHRDKKDGLGNYIYNLGYPSSLGYFIGYHYFIEKDGTLIQARADTDEGAHTIGENISSLGVCMAGNFDVELPTLAQITTLKELLKRKCVEYKLSTLSIYPHRVFANKSCYGHLLSDSWASLLLTIKPQSEDVRKEIEMLKISVQLSLISILIQKLRQLFERSFSP